MDRTRVLASAIALVLLSASVEAAPETVRVFALGYKHRVDDAKSYADYRAHLVALAEAADPDPGNDPDPRPKIFLFPEDTALYAMFTGGRGAPFPALEPLLRQAGGNGSSAAVAGLFAAYQAQAAYYRQKFPAENFSQARLGLLALTDTLYRSFYETFREIAVRHHAWVVAAANVAPATITRDPAAASLLADPTALSRPCAGIAPPCAYEATTANVYNQAFVFDPRGELVFNPFPAAREGDLDGALKKTYLVPVEQGPLEQGKIGLDLAYGDLRQVRPIQIAGVPMGILISKPAWMLDELGRLEAYDARVLLQPEAFSGWGAPVEDWNPDVLKQSNWSAVQKHAPFRFGALAELTGNFFDLVFDAQNHVVEKARAKPATALRSIGQPADGGWRAVSPWVADDGEGKACPQPTLAGRRACLAEVARALAPASGDARENGYVEPFVQAEVSLHPPPADATRAAGVLGASLRIDDAPGDKRARNPRAALAPDGATLVVWQDDREGLDEIRIARIAPDGAVIGSRLVAAEPFRRQVLPQVAVTASGEIWVVWQDLDPAPRIMAAWANGFGSDFEEPFSLSQNTPFAAEEWKPAVAAAGNTLHVAHVALDDTLGLAVPAFEHVVYTRVIRHGPGDYTVEFRAIDERAFDAPDPLAERLNNRWSPAVAARDDTVALAWSDFRNYSWDLDAAVSRNGGNSLLDPANPPELLRVDDASRLGGAAANLERLHADAAVLIAADGTVDVAWTDQAGRRAGCAACAQQRRPDADIAFARLAPGASEFPPNVRIDDTGDGLQSVDRRGFSNQWRPALANDSAGGRLVAAWQDQREGNDDVYLSWSSDGGATWAANRRVDDTGDGPSNQYAPALTIDAQGTLTVLWQDDRDGADHLYAARGTLTGAP